jgi:hypothetical protein
LTLKGWKTNAHQVSLAHCWAATDPELHDDSKFVMVDLFIYHLLRLGDKVAHSPN